MTKKIKKPVKSKDKPEIVPIQREKVRRVCIRPASFEMVDTGEKRVVRVMGRDGLTQDEERSVLHEVMRPAEFIEETYTETVYAVYDGTDTHEFTDRAVAETFATENF